MAWNLQQINGGTVTTVPGEPVVVPYAPAAAGSGPFVCTFGDQQHFVYIDNPVVGNLQDCWYDDATSEWRLQQINNGSNPTVPGEPVAVADAPAGWGGPFVCTFGDQQHFTYIDVNGNLQDCVYDDASGWHLQQINGGTKTTVPGEPVAVPDAPAAAGSGPFVCTFGDQQHFTYIDVNGNLQDCWYDNATSEWRLQQINNGSNPTVPGEPVAVPDAPAIALPSSLFVCTFGDQQHFTYIDVNGNLQDCVYDDASGWHLQQINGGTKTTVPGEPVAVPDAPVTSLPDWPVLFVCTFGDQQHFTYSDVNGNLQDCWYDDATAGWHLQQINGGTKTTVPGEYVAVPDAPAMALNDFSSLFVCTFGDQQHFAYIDVNGNLQDCWYDDTSGWHLQQINGGTKTTVPGEYVAVPDAPVGSSLFVCTFGNQQHFTYVDGNNNLQDCWWG
jgi:rubredoxin